MKLLRLKIGKLPEEKCFRSLHSGFEIVFNTTENHSLQSMKEFNPFCFAGLNGRGKSNVLEALATIFFHLECCAAKFRPKSFSLFRPESCIIDAFTLEYLIQKNNGIYSLDNFVKVIVHKEEYEVPTMTIIPHPFQEKREKISLIPSSNEITEKPTPADGKVYLPDIIVGYSSGENEVLSIPFRKSRLINFDKYKEDFKEKYEFEEPENSLIYIDNGMSQAVLLACLLYEDPETTLQPLRRELGIIDICSFRMNINIHRLENKENNKAPITEHIKDKIESLKSFATCWYEQKDENKNPINLSLDFYINDATRQAFKEIFTTSFEFFRFFQVLYELNSQFIPETIKQEVYQSKGVYTEGKIPEGSPEDNVFYFLDFLILKEIQKGVTKELLLKEFSDGEHQFIHTMCICLMLKNKRCLLLLDEPETHFNPQWRSKFIQILNSCITAGGGNNLLKEVVLTSHSPFIFSDCKPERVILFNKKKNRLITQTAKDIDINTYGASVDFLMKAFGESDILISEKSKNELEQAIQSNDINIVRQAIDKFGESSEKQFLYSKLYELKK